MENDFDNLFDGMGFGGDPSDPRSGEWFERKTQPQHAMKELEVHVVSVFEAIAQSEDKPEERLSVEYFVLLQDNSGRQFRIMVVPEMASAIHMAHRHITPDRPLTHDLCRTLIDRLGANVDRVVIDDLLQLTYYAKIVINQGDRQIELDARPSDAIAVALRCKAPIYAVESVLEANETQED